MKILRILFAELFLVSVAMAGGSRATNGVATNYIDLAKPASTTNTAFCIWIKPIGVPNNGNWFSKYVSAPCEYEMGAWADASQAYFIRMDTQYVHDANAYSVYPNFAFVCGVYNGTMYEYVNGVSVGTPITYTRGTNTAGNLNVGRRPYPGGEAPSTGTFAGASVFNRALTANEVKELASGCVNCMNRSAYTGEWLLMESSGPFKDTSGHGYTGTDHYSTENMSSPPLFFSGGGGQQ